MHLDEFVCSIRTPDNADEIDWFAACVRDDQHEDEFPFHLTADGWSEELEAWRLIMGLAPAILDAASVATPDVDGYLTLPLDDETALDLALGPRPTRH